MEVAYHAEGHERVVISCRLPNKGELLTDVVKEYEPLAYWIQQAAEIDLPEVGAAGYVDHSEFRESNETQPVSEIPMTTIGG